MALKQRIVWTVLPWGFTESGRPRVSVLVAPQLTPDAAVVKLGKFEDWVNWPRVVETLKFEFRIDGTSVGGRQIGVKLEPKLWQLLFPKEETVVFGYKPKNYGDRFVHVFPTGDVHDVLKGFYGALAAQAGESRPRVRGDNRNPLVKGLVDVLKPIAQRPDMLMSRIEKVKQERRGSDGKPLRFYDTGNPSNYGFPPTAEGRVQLNFLLAHRFYSRPENKQTYYRTPAEARAAGKKAPMRPAIPEIDFHGKIAALGDFPALMRRLGLVLDFELDVDPGAMATDGEISLAAPWAGGGFPQSYNADTFPLTQYRIRPKDLFVARPRNPEGDIVDGMLRLEQKGGFDILQIDTDGIALKTLQFAENMARQDEPVNPGAFSGDAQPRLVSSVGQPEEEGAPAIRTGGLILIRRRRGPVVTARLAATQKTNEDVAAGGQPKLFAEDVARGFRLDVLDSKTSRWRSLCYRDQTFLLPKAGERIVAEAEEGYVRTTNATSAVGGAPGSDLYIHESMAEWEGWSLVAHRPGRMIEEVNYNEDGTPREHPIVRPAVNEPRPVAGFDLVEFSKPTDGTLPRLRFGRKYRMRARVVDLAGNSLSMKEAEVLGDTHVSEEQQFLRYEPLGSPTLVPNDVFREGESVDHMTIRSNYNLSADEWAAKPYVNDVVKEIDAKYRGLNDGFGYSYKGFNERHVVPPKTSQHEAEIHGSFDPAMGPGGNPEAMFAIAMKEEGRLSDTQVHDGAGGMIDVSANIRIITTPDAKQGAPMATLPLAPGAPLGSGQYIVNTGTEIVLPYLPDPLARGAAFRALPGANDEGDIGGGAKIVRLVPGTLVTLVPFDLNWPKARPFRIKIVETATVQKPSWDGAVLTVYMPKATKARVVYSCYMGDEDTALMGVAAWITNNGQRNAARQLATKGSHWMLTPWRQMTLTHAVQQPLELTEFYKPELGKPDGIGSTVAVFGGYVKTHVRSTGRLDLLAEWSEWIDDLNENGPREVQHRAHAFDVIVPERLDRSVGISESKLVSIPIPPEKPNDLPKEWRHQFGDTHYRSVNYRLKATTRFREYMPVRLWRDPINLPQFDTWTPANETEQAELDKRIHRINEALTLKVPNSARPEAPKVLYAIPTFGWEQSNVAGAKVSRRCGNAIRVYLDRPWYSSGDGELLGVVMRQSSGISNPTFANPTSGNDGTLKGLVTEWGLDPIWGSASPTSVNPGAFPLAEKVQPDLSLDELGPDGSKVTVAGHVVEYDWQRRLWYCDIEINAGDSYYPFVRLALARFQPESIPNAHLSRVALCEFVQLAPDRVAAVQPMDGTRIRVLVSGVFGLNQFSAGNGPWAVPTDDNKVLKNMGRSRDVRVTVEELTGTGTTEGSWTPVANLIDISLPVTRKVDNVAIWSGDMVLPEKAQSQGGTKRYRLAIREYERFDADPYVKIPVPDEKTRQPILEGILNPGGPVINPGPIDVDIAASQIRIAADGTVLTQTNVEKLYDVGGVGGGKMMTYSKTITIGRAIERIVYADTIEL